jgi:hypothetical protein
VNSSSSGACQLVQPIREEVALCAPNMFSLRDERANSTLAFGLARKDYSGSHVLVGNGVIAFRQLYCPAISVELSFVLRQAA